MNTAPATRTRLGLESLDERAVMSATALPEAIPVAAPALVRHDASQPQISIASEGVTRVPPTQRDINLMNKLTGKKWQYVGDVTNPYTGGVMRITAEIVFSGKTFSLIEVGRAYGPFGVSTYPASSSGKWFVQNNGILVLRHDNPRPAEYWSKWQFLTLQSVRNGQIVSPDGGVWNRIPLNATGIPGL